MLEDGKLSHTHGEASENGHLVKCILLNEIAIKNPTQLEIDTFNFIPKKATKNPNQPTKQMNNHRESKQS